MANPIWIRKTGCAWFSFFLVFCLAACDRPDPATELDSAAQNLANGDFEGAALRLNYVVQVQPDSVRARELRGAIALQLGDYPGAVAELRRARELGATNQAVALDLADALIGAGQAGDALKLLDTTREEFADEPLYWTLRAEALLAADRVAEAQLTLEGAGELTPGDARALTTRAQVAFAAEEQAQAFSWINQALAVAPDDPRVRIAYAELLARSDRLQEAAGELRRAADIYRDASIAPRETLSLLALVQVHLARNDLDAAEEVAARLMEQAPEVQPSAYYQGLVKFRRGRFDEAASLVQPLVNASPENIQYRSLLGAIQLSRGSLGQAEQQFLRVLAISPREPAAAKLLAETRLRQQRPDAALDALLAVQDAAAQDAQIGLLSGMATLLSGNAEQGLLYLEQAAALDPSNELARLQLARAYVAVGRNDEAAGLLDQAFGREANEIEAGLLRLFAEGGRGETDSAAEIAAGLIANYPQDPRVLTSVGVYFQLTGQAERARELFEQAAGLETEDATARLFVAGSLVQEGRPDEAELLLRETVSQQPENARAIAGLAQLLATRGNLDEAVTLFARAAEQTRSVIPRLALAQLQLRRGEIGDARRQIDIASAAAPENPDVLALGGVVSLAEGRAEAALQSLERAAALQPNRLGVTLALARAQLANGQAEAARDGLLRAVERAPQSYPVRLALGDAELANGNFRGAAAVATDLKVLFPSQAGGYFLEGRVFIAERQYAEAAKSFSLAYERQPGWPVLSARIQALRLAGNQAEAMSATESWLAENPGNVPGLLTRGVMLQAAGRGPEALQAYQAVLQVEPRSVVALNNAAWVAHELSNPEALALAERAFNVDPDNAAVLDTFGWILLAEGRYQAAVEKLSRAAELAPQAPEIRYHLAEALAAAGQSLQAEELLAALLNESGSFEERAAAGRLLESMQEEAATNP